MSDDESESPLAGVWRRLRRNVGIVVGERILFALVNLVAISVATRAAGLEAIGVIGLLTALAGGLSALFAFQSWQAILRFGARYRVEETGARLEGLVGATLAADLLAVLATVAATALAAPWLGPAIGLDAEATRFAPWFVGVFTFGSVHMTQIGVLRLYDRVPLIAAQHASIATIRLLGAVAVWLLGYGAEAIILVWAAAYFFAGCLLWTAAFATLRREGLRPRLMRVSALGLGRREFFGFLGVTNVIATIEASVPMAMMFFVGAKLGVADAGLFHLIRQISQALARPADFLGPLIFPEIADLQARGDRRSFSRLTTRAAVVASLVGLGAIALILPTGSHLLAFMFGPETARGGPTLALATAAAAVLVAGFALEPALLSAGRARQALLSNLLPWILLILGLVFLIDSHGLFGAGLAVLAHRAAQLALRIVYARRAIRAV